MKKILSSRLKNKGALPPIPGGPNNNPGPYWGFIGPEFRFDLHPDIGFPVQEITLWDCSQTGDLDVDLPIRGGKLDPGPGIDHFGKGINLSDDRVAQGLPLHLRVAVRAMGPGRSLTHVANCGELARYPCYNKIGRLVYFYISRKGRGMVMGKNKFGKLFIDNLP